MSIRFLCTCGQWNEAPAGSVGRTGTCSGCAQRVDVPDPLGRTAPAGHYVDVVDERSWDLVGGRPALEAVEAYPDLDLAWLYAAYPGSWFDHERADLHLLRAGLTRSRVKSRLLAQLCSWYLGHMDVERAFRCAVLFLRARRGPIEPLPAQIEALGLLSRVFDRKGFRRASRRVRSLHPGNPLPPGSQVRIREATGWLLDARYNVLIRKAADRLAPPPSAWHVHEIPSAAS